jgi:hypothetical protein
VAAGYGGVESGALFFIQVVTVVEDGQIDLCPFRSIVRLIKLQPTLMNLGLQLQHGPSVTSQPPSWPSSTGWMENTRGPFRCLASFSVAIASTPSGTSRDFLLFGVVTMPRVTDLFTRI